VNISEYGTMHSNGIPGEAVKWISRIEDSKVSACVAYWRLANNLCDVVADDVMPNGNYWLYRFYGSMRGKTVKTNISDLFQSNFENAFIKRKEGYHIDGLSGVAAIDAENRIASVVTGGTADKYTVELASLKKTEAFRDVDRVLVTVYRTDFRGLVGEVAAPDKYLEFNARLTGSPLNVKIGEGTKTRAFYIEVKPYENGADIDYKNTLYTARYEAEDAEKIGQANSYEHAFAYSGTGFLGYIDTDSDAAQFHISVPRDGRYRLDIVYSNGSLDENGKRVNASQHFYIDGEQQDDIVYPSSIKFEHSACVSRTVTLSKGDHVLKLSHGSFSAGLDFIDITEIDENAAKDIFTQKDYNNSSSSKTAYLICAPKDDFYSVKLDFTSPVNNAGLTVNSTVLGSATAENKSEKTVFLRRGISYIEIDSPSLSGLKVSAAKGNINDYSVNDFTLDGAVVRDDFITDISSENGNTAALKVNCDEAGIYALTVYYSNDGEGGLHDYNVDLVEKYVSFKVNGESVGNVFFRNTYSLDTVKTKTVYLRLEKGENTITFANDGSSKFNSITSFAPEIRSVSVAKAFTE
jgi:hypothetical protein